VSSLKGFCPKPPTRGSVPGPRWELRLQNPVIPSTDSFWIRTFPIAFWSNLILLCRNYMTNPNWYRALSPLFYNGKFSKKRIRNSPTASKCWITCIFHKYVLQILKRWLYSQSGNLTETPKKIDTVRSEIIYASYNAVTCLTSLHKSRVMPVHHAVSWWAYWWH